MFAKIIWTFANSLKETINPIGGIGMILLANHGFPLKKGGQGVV